LKKTQKFKNLKIEIYKKADHIVQPVLTAVGGNDIKTKHGKKKNIEKP